MIIRTVCLLMLAMLLLACAPDDIGTLPPERPFGTISGQAVAGPIANAQVTVYGFGNGTQGTRLGSAQTDDNGAYSIDIQAPSQIVLVEIRGGSYVEEASGTPVALADEQVLRAIGRYRSGQPLTLMVTPLTHMAVALAEYNIGNGMAVAQAIDEATADIDRFFALDVRSTTPVLITASDEPATELTGGALYGFYLAGLSNWTLWANGQGPTPRDHAGDNSLSLAQILYHDLRSDGLLDGRGFNPDATELVPLAFGAMALDADNYRRAFSLHMLAMANGPQNKTGLTAADLADAAHAIAAQTSLMPGGTPPVAIDGRITGKAATIANAQVTVYGFADGERGLLLGQGQTDANGNFDITIQAPDQPLLLELTGGSYVEVASGASVALTEGQILRTVARFRSGQSLNLMMTPLTHMATALAEYKIGNGMAVTQAIDEATAAIDQFFPSTP